MRVLLADDSPLILTRMRDMAEHHKGVEIVGMAGNGPDALEALKLLKPDMVILDIEMAGLSGLEILHEIRKVDKSLTFVVLALFSSDDNRKEAMNLGANYFFSKSDGFKKIDQLLTTRVAREKWEKRQVLV